MEQKPHGPDSNGEPCHCTACSQWAFDELERLRKVAETTTLWLNWSDIACDEQGYKYRDAAKERTRAALEELKCCE